MRHLAALAALAAAATAGDLQGLFPGGLDHPAIQYNSRPAHDAAAELNRNLRDGKVKLRFDPSYGYLPALLDVLRVPAESQMLVFSKTSVQAQLIHTRNPRALYFNDTVVVGYVRDGAILEVAAQDPELGTISMSCTRLRRMCRCSIAATPASDATNRSEAWACRGC